ncbi:L,D-transpeptidase, partial [Candidatus Peregrinibacteria bacterium]|nr:L,D-transpeptidase [Candidatus Peregrinibacteria bacterium]
PVSTGSKGFNNAKGSNGSPSGMHKIARKGGEDLPLGADIRSGKIRNIDTASARPSSGATMTTRALYIGGLEKQGTETRGVAIHGTNHEGTVLYPPEVDGVKKGSSHGCIRMLNSDVADLFERIKEGTLVEVYDRKIEAAKVA